VNVHVGEVVFGVTTGTDRIERLTLGGDDDASVRVRMSPDTAWSVAYSSDPIRAVREGLASGAITYEGIGFGNVAMVETVRLGGSAAQFVDRTIVARLPTSYDIATGDQREITHQGQSVVLERNALGHRIIDGGGDTLGVVDRRGESVGVTTRGVQRLVAAPTPSGWTPFSRPSVGVYAQWTAQQAGPGLTLHLPAHGWRGA
jgi:hypothetical protein